MTISGPTSSLHNRHSLGRAGLALFVLLGVLPMVFSLGYALAYSTGLAGLLSEGLTGRHWGVLIREREIWASLGLSLYVAIVSVVLTIGIALPLALYLRRPIGYGALSYIIYFPLALPATVAAFLVYQLFSATGYASRILIHWGLIDGMAQFPPLVNDPFGVGIIIAHTGFAVPFFILLFVEMFNSERLEGLSAVARTLGASRGQVIYRLQVPVLLKKGMTNIVLFFIAVLGSYEIPLLLGRQTPQMISVLTMRKYAMFDIQEKPEAFIIALLYTAIVLACLLVVFGGMRRAHER
jgi:putative spermidine/putrescine transport system permease protein